MASRQTLRRAGMAASAAAGFVGFKLFQDLVATSLRDQVVLITGGSRGLGLLLAREFADQGCKVALCARDEIELERARLDIAARGVPALGVPCDVADPNQVQRMVDEVTARLGGIDILVNNASIIQVGPLETMTRADFEEAMNVNFWGCLNTIYSVLPQMRLRGAGRIVNIASIGGKVAVPHLLPYDAAKFAVVGLSEGLRAELSRHGIRVTTIIPGLMRTGSPVNAFFKGQKEREFALFSLGDATPLSAMDATRAARRIVKAARRGEAEVVLSWQAKLLRLAHDLFPTTVTNLLALVNRALPTAKGADNRMVRGMELATALSPSPLTWLMNRAARANNEYGGSHKPSHEHAARVGLDGEQA